MEISKLSQIKSVFVHNSEVMTLLCNSTKARTLLGWEPQYTLKQGLCRTVEYIRNHPTRQAMALNL
jgi:nucleoside-diphosphate-sugar epimerase